MYILPDAQVEMMLELIAKTRKLSFEVDILVFEYEHKFARNQIATLSSLQEICRRMNEVSRGFSRMSDFFSMTNFYRPEITEDK